MKNSEIKAVYICILITTISIISIFLSMPNGNYAIAFLSIFVAISGFLISFLFISRADCMGKMLNGTDLLASWLYSEEETIQNMMHIKEENKGLWAIAIPFFSIVIIIILVVIGIGEGTIGFSIFATLLLLTFNLLLFKVFMHLDNHKDLPNEIQIEFDKRNKNKRYVYISTKGIYANGQLHVWKGWGSKLKEIHYDQNHQNLSFTYTYLRPYGMGNYTVEIRIPSENDLSLIRDFAQRNAILTNL